VDDKFTLSEKSAFRNPHSAILDVHVVIERREDIISGFDFSQPLLVNGVGTQGFVQPSETE